MKNNVVFLGCTSEYGYQFSAANTKTEFIAKGLVEQGDSCTIHNGIIGKFGLNGKKETNVEGVGNVITYSRNCSQFVSWIFNLRPLCHDLKHLYSKSSNNVVVLEAPDYHIFLIYVLLAKFFHYKIAVIAHEWGPTIVTTHPLRRPSVWIYTKTFGYFVNGILPISEYIIRKTRHFNKPYLKVPVLADFSKMPHKDLQSGKYFLYCVYSAYIRVISEIIDAYKKYFDDGGRYGLTLVLSGNEKQIGNVASYIKSRGLEHVINIKSKLPYKTLLNLYDNASALLIPLNPKSEQDEARFSQKIAEYLSSASPIISNNVGEVKHYFADRKNIVLCDYSANGFSEAFYWIASNPQKSTEIGICGYKLGEKEFDYHVNGKKIHDFFQTL